MAVFTVTFQTPQGQAEQETMDSQDDAALTGRLFAPGRTYREGQVVTRILEKGSGRIVPLPITINSQLAALNQKKVAA